MLILDLWLQWYRIWRSNMGSFYSVVAFQSKSRKIKFQWEITIIGYFMTGSTILLYLIMVKNIWISLPCPLIIFPSQKKRACCTSDPLPDSIYVTYVKYVSILPNILTSHKLLSYIMIIPNINITLLVKTLSMSGRKEDTSPGSML